MSTQSIGTIAARLDRLPASRWHNKILWLLGLGILADCLDLYLGGSVLAALVASGWSNNELNGYFISGTMAGFLVGALIAGSVGDKLGRKKALTYNLIFFGTSSIAAAFATDMWTLIWLRSIMGMGLGAQFVATYGTFGEFLPPLSRGKYASLVALIGNVGPPVATVIAMLVLPLFGWRPLFFGVGVFAFVVLILQNLYLVESPRWLACKGLIDQADKIVTQAEKEIEAQRGIKLPPVEITGPPEECVNLPYMAIFKGQLLYRTIALTAGLCGVNVAIYTMVNWIPTIFVQAGLTVTKSLAMTTVILLGAPFGMWVCSLVVDNVPRKGAMVFILLAMSVVGYIYALQRAEFLIMSVGFVLITLLYFYVSLVCSVYAGEIFPTEARLRGVGFANGVSRLSAVVTPPVIALILTHYGPVAVFLTVSAILVLIAGVIAVFGVETRHKTLEEINEHLVGRGASHGSSQSSSKNM
ncbi:MAG: MFS transporter [Negativicutes bacterium]|nr:MFS transporter [Negativicutes bacterium]